MAFDPTALDDLAAALKAAGIRDVSTDLAALNLPGVWVQWAGVNENILAGSTITVRLVCISPDRDARRSMDVMATLYGQVLAVVDPVGPSTTGAISMPSDPTPYPALSIPFEIHTT